MKSKAQFKSHPIHPMLIPFPFTLLIAGFVCDLAGWLRDSVFAWRMGSYLVLAGVLSGGVAAIPGLIDYLFVVPPNSSGKRRATQHMLVNACALALFLLSWFMHGDLPAYTVLVPQALGVALLSLGGWLGGTLVYRNQIGVDHRYARAGKWREATVSSGEPAAREDELKPGQMKLLRVEGTRLVLARTDDEYCAFDDRCTHKGGSLADGVLACGIVTCPWHGSQFDVQTGTVKAGPAEKPIGTRGVEVVGREVRIR